MDEQTMEQRRLRLLRAIYEKTGENESLHINIFDTAGSAGMTDDEEIEHIRQGLVEEGLLRYAGPFGGVCITKRGIEVAKTIPSDFT